MSQVRFNHSKNNPNIMSISLDTYRASTSEQQRIADIFSLLPATGGLALDIGARDGYLARLLAERFDKVVALDLMKPEIDHPKIEPVGGDATCLQFPDDHFDVVLCAEVLEHIPEANLEKACSEIARVARNRVVIGVPYRQDLRCGRTTCESCGKTNPPWGHVNSFDEDRLRSLFPGLTWERETLVGSNLERTNPISAALLNFAGNPFGTWQQQEYCVHCGKPIGSPVLRNLSQRVATRAAFVLNRLQSKFINPQASWIHVLLSKHAAKF
jgi:SAM-dependent methyltransferase